MDINREDKVLEIGSGHQPYYRSDVLLDKFPSGQDERGGKLVIDRPLVIGDAENLPFKDKSFDFVIASHLLEHARHPEQLLKEITRVGKKGYIETPSPLRERVKDWPFHRWYVFKQDKKLVLIRKTNRSQKLLTNYNLKDKKHLHYLDETVLSNTKLEWDKEIKYEIFQSETDNFLKNLDEQISRMIKTRRKDPRFWLALIKTILIKVPYFGKVVASIKTILFRAPRSPKDLIAKKILKQKDLFPILVCPQCKEKLSFSPKIIFCPKCKKKYQYYRQRIPILTT